MVAGRFACTSCWPRDDGFDAVRKRRFQREDWVHLGLSELSEKGVESVKLEAICKASGLTKGSFYHHFEDHPAFLVAMAEAWFDLQADVIIDDLEQAEIPDDVYQRLNAAIMDIDFPLELGMREIARRAETVAKVVKRMDSRRLEVLQKIYQRRFGLSPSDARVFARLEYAAFNGAVLIAPDMTANDLNNMGSQFNEMVRLFLSGRKLSTERG